MGEPLPRAWPGYFPTATDDPNAPALNAGRKVVFSRTLNVAGFRRRATIADGDLGPECARATGKAATATSWSTVTSASGVRSRGST